MLSFDNVYHNLSRDCDTHYQGTYRGLHYKKKTAALFLPPRGVEINFLPKCSLKCILRCPSVKLKENCVEINFVVNVLVLCYWCLHF